MRRIMRRVGEAVERLPLRWRLTLVFFALLAVLLGSLGTLISLTEEHALFTNQAAALHQEVRLALPDQPGRHPSIALTPPTPAATGTLPASANSSLDVVIHRLASASVRATLLAPDGTLLASTQDVALAPAVVELSAQDVQTALTTAHTTDSYTIRRDTSGQRQLVVVLPLVSNGQTVALLELNTPTAPIDAAVATMRLILALGIAGTLILAAMLLLPLVRAALRPLEVMERTTTHIAEGDLSLRLDVPLATDEIGRLARSFNRMVARLEATFDRQKRFVADVSHELRTPLTALGGGVEMLMLGADGGDIEASHRLLRGMYGEIERMRRLVADLLTLTRLDEGRLQPQHEDVRVGAVLRAVAEQAPHLTHGQQIVKEVDEPLPLVHADADWLRQVLLTLLDNALKYTPSEGRVTLRAAAVRAGPPAVRLTVADTGAGIAPEALPHVFERFYRADPSRTRAAERVGGSGLGLAIAKGLIEAQGGTITITSTPGAGTTVAITLPAVSDLPGASSPGKSTARGRREPLPAASTGDEAAGARQPETQHPTR